MDKRWFFFGKQSRFKASEFQCECCKKTNWLTKVNNNLLEFRCHCRYIFQIRKKYSVLCFWSNTRRRKIDLCTIARSSETEAIISYNGCFVRHHNKYICHSIWILYLNFLVSHSRTYTHKHNCYCLLFSFFFIREIVVFLLKTNLAVSSKWWCLSCEHEEHLFFLQFGEWLKIMVIRCRHNHYFLFSFPDFGDFISGRTKEEEEKWRKIK